MRRSKASEKALSARSMLPEAQRGYLVPVGSEAAHALAEKIRLLAALPDARRGPGRGNRRRVEERYSFAALCAAYREVYHAALCA